MVDLIAVLWVSLVLLILVLALCSRLRGWGRIKQCASNLRQLGVAAALYEKENNDYLPYAFAIYKGKNPTTWDGLIFSYIPTNGFGRIKSHLLLCPSDTIEANPKLGIRRRTYAMPIHNMSDNPDFWPPGPENRTGVGLWWKEGAEFTRANITNAIPTIDQTSNPARTAFRLHTIPAPAATLFLTEHARSNNIAFHYYGATIRGPQDHVDETLISVDQYHGGKFNYLTLDAHVEFLTPLQSEGRGDLEENNSTKQYPNIWFVSH